MVPRKLDVSLHWTAENYIPHSAEPIYSNRALEYLDLIRSACGCATIVYQNIANLGPSVDFWGIQWACIAIHLASRICTILEDLRTLGTQFSSDTPCSKARLPPGATTVVPNLPTSHLPNHSPSSPNVSCDTARSYAKNPYS